MIAPRSPVQSPQVRVSQPHGHRFLSLLITSSYVEHTPSRRAKTLLYSLGAVIHSSETMVQCRKPNLEECFSNFNIRYGVFVCLFAYRASHYRPVGADSDDSAIAGSAGWRVSPPLVLLRLDERCVVDGLFSATSVLP